MKSAALLELAGAASDLIPAPFIVGAPRSGTTLLRLMLDAHPDLAIPPETGFVAVLGRDMPANRGPEDFLRAITDFPPGAPSWPDFGIDRAVLLEEVVGSGEEFSATEALRIFYRSYARRFGKTRWGDKTPTHCLQIPEIRRLVPESHFIHIVRDGRDVALSLRNTWFSPGQDAGVLANYWSNCVSTARRDGSSVGGYLELRYEDLVLDPETQLRRICSFIKIPFFPSMLDYHDHAGERLEELRTRYRSDGSVLVSHDQRLSIQKLSSMPPASERVQAWRSSMPEEEAGEFLAVAKSVMDDFGYC